MPWLFKIAASFSEVIGQTVELNTNTIINNDQEAYMDKSDPEVFEGRIATLDTL